MAPRRRTSRKKSGPGAAGTLIFLFFLGVCALIGAAAWFIFTPSGPNQEVFVEIAPGSTSRQIAAQLESSGVIRSRYAFDAVRLWKHASLKAGEYRFDQSATVPEVYSRIARGDVFTLAVTFPEGSTRFDIAQRLVQAGFLNLTQEKFLAATLSETPLIADLDPHAASLEGYLFPDTYRFQRRVTPTQVISAMVRRFRTEAAQIGLIQIGLKQSSRSIHDTVTLASLVERETATPTERPLVASVLTNRLDKKMPLMTDPAVIYGLQLNNEWRGTIYQSDLTSPAKDTPYNTYRHAGLPPGPIANPGMASLRAAMSPANTNYLYFVAAGLDPQGKSLFAATLDQHNKNVAAYRKAIKEANKEADANASRSSKSH